MMASLEPKSKVLVIGALEYFGKFITGKSLELGHSTSVMVPSTTNPAQDYLIQKFVNLGVAVIRVKIFSLLLISFFLSFSLSFSVLSFVSIMG